jgi:hypothetical protein
MCVLGDPQRLETTLLEFVGESFDTDRQVGGKNQSSDVHGVNPPRSTVTTLGLHVGNWIAASGDALPAV